MRIKIIAIALLIFMSALSSSSSAAGQPSYDRAEDEAAIRKVVTRMQEGWNKGDGKGFAAPFAADAHYVVINGMWLKGRDKIAAGHQRIFDTFYKDSHNEGTVKSITFIRADVALVHVEWLLNYREQNSAREGRALSSMVMTKENGQWSIAAFQNTRIADEQK